jgi:hypothetical protein
MSGFIKYHSENKIDMKSLKIFGLIGMAVQKPASKEVNIHVAL